MKVIEAQHVETRFGEKFVHRDVNFSVNSGSIVAVIGASGCGKSVLLKEIVGLLRPTAGEIEMFGVNVWKSTEEDIALLRRRYGVLFQNGALFSALTVGENVAVPIVEQAELEDSLIKSVVQLRLALVGLEADVCGKMPSELSGGMRKRVALARALSLEPELLFLDEPTSGLDPISARSFDHLISTLSKSLGLTIFMVTHDLDSICSISDRVLVLEGGRVLADGPVEEVSNVDHPWIRSYFSRQVNGAAN
ncbi:ABC transporter ATP-binding protein [bacterium J17]|nr:ABC transporter ATP-binding protein [bacterium J17]